MAYRPKIENIFVEEFRGKIIALESLKQKNSPFKMLSTLAITGFQRIGASSVFIEPNIKGFFLKKIRRLISAHLCFNVSWKRSLEGKDVNENSYGNPTGVTLDSNVPALHTFAIWSVKGAMWSVWKYLQYVINASNIFDLHICGVYVGDQIVSSHVRFSNNYPSKFKKDLRLIITLMDSYLTVQYAFFLVKVVKVSVFMVSHNCYRYALFNRVSLYSGNSYLVLGRFPFSMYVSSDTVSGKYPGILQIGTFSDLSNIELEAAKEYMSGRTTPGTNLLQYMDGDAYSAPKVDFLFAQGKDACNVCVFLHSFSDALFINGPDTFNDLWEWTLTTIDNLCVETDKKVNVLVKPHPNVFLQHKMGSTVITKDLNTYEKLREHYQQYTNVIFLPAAVSNKQLADLPGFIGITHHGNVATELAYLGLPVISSVHAPWKYERKFLITWSDRKEYIRILNNINEFASFRPDNASLFKFAFYYYIKFPGGFRTPSFLNGIYKSVFGCSKVTHMDACNAANEITTKFLEEPLQLENSLPQFYLYLEQALKNNLYR